MENVDLLKERYSLNKATHIGAEISCAFCGNKFFKKSYHNAFCCVSCKDRYHNAVNPERHLRATACLSKKRKTSSVGRFSLADIYERIDRDFEEEVWSQLNDGDFGECFGDHRDD